MRITLINRANQSRLFLTFAVWILFSLMLVSCGSQEKTEPEEAILAKSEEGPAPVLNRLTEEKKAEG